MDMEIMIRLWETLREYIPAKDRQGAADHVIADLIDSGLEDEDLKQFNGLDKYMSIAVEEYIDEEEDYDEDEWDEDW